MSRYHSHLSGSWRWRHVANCAAIFRDTSLTVTIERPVYQRVFAARCWRLLSRERVVYRGDSGEATRAGCSDIIRHVMMITARLCVDDRPAAAEAIWKWGGAHGERGARAYKGVWGRSPQRSPAAEPLVRGAKPPEAERFLGIIRRKDRQYLPLYPTFESAEISQKHCLESK